MLISNFNGTMVFFVAIISMFITFLCTGGFLRKAKQNLEGIEIYGPARKEYEAWMVAMKEK